MKIIFIIILSCLLMSSCVPHYPCKESAFYLSTGRYIVTDVTYHNIQFKDSATGETINHPLHGKRGRRIARRTDVGEVYTLDKYRMTLSCEGDSSISTYDVVDGL